LVKASFNILSNHIFVQVPLLHVIFLYFLLIDHQLCLHECMFHFYNFKLCHPIMVVFCNLYLHPKGPTLMFHYIIYLWKKVVCLFCFVCTNEIHRTKMLQIVFLVSLESSQWGGVHHLGFMAFGLVVQKLLNIKWFFCWKLN
jgi:hypothetical protein